MGLNSDEIACHVCF